MAIVAKIPIAFIAITSSASGKSVSFSTESISTIIAAHKVSTLDTELSETSTTFSLVTFLTAGPIIAKRTFTYIMRNAFLAKRFLAVVAANWLVLEMIFDT
jgi:hypothetical protein